MNTILKAAGLTIAMAAAGAATAIPAQAQTLELQIGPDGIRPVQPDYRRPDDRRGPPPRGGCSEREARAAARDYGLRDPEVVRVTRSRVTVEGMTRRGPERISFANERGCPDL